MRDVKGLPQLHPIAGVRLGTACAGIRTEGRPDLVIMELSSGAGCAAVFTRNAFYAAPVAVAKQHLGSAAPRYLLINTGYANAGTGQEGLRISQESCAVLADQTGCLPAQVLPFSTGIIGEPLPLEAIVRGIPNALDALDENGWLRAAEGIMTTDTVPKAASRRIERLGKPVSRTGVAKGAGMIRPDMATMLAFIATDIGVDEGLLQRSLDNAVGESFNRITVDGDTSTNDACVLIATGSNGLTLSSDREVAYQSFSRALADLCRELAQSIVRDGEGATKLVTICIEAGRDKAECTRAAYTIAHSPLVKTALFAGDPNWGRILASLGRAEIADFDISRVNIYLDEVCVVQDGARAAEYTEEQGARVMARSDITIRVELGRGDAKDQVWTCDLSYDYVRINAEYRT
ncbi:MAG: bifunctional glutamate N-acetyltransferase/amino-acid acetyltransferase ArgJ [Gammaproteobacteria bacterium]